MIGSWAVDEESIFLEALAISSPERQSAFLDEACGGNNELRRAVEELLELHAERKSFLETPPTLLQELWPNSPVDKPEEMIEPEHADESSTAMKIRLEIVKGPHTGRSFEFSGHDTFLVGRGRQAHFQLNRDDMYFSRSHFMIEVNPPNCRLLDLNSHNGTFVNREKVLIADLNNGDLVRGGKTLMRVSISKEVASQIAPEVESPELPCAEPPLELEIIEEEEGSNTWHHLKDLLPSDYEQKIRQLNQSIPGFLLIQRLGKGGMGDVWLALRESDKSIVAIKTILPQVSTSSLERERFLREAHILKSLNHPHIVQFREMGDAYGMLYFAMEYVPGIDAGKLIKQADQPLPISRAVSLVLQILDALEYAHASGFVHRDIKPSNLLVTRAPGEERIKVADFGLARLYQSSKISGLTMTNQIGGTVKFMPPEQITDYRNVTPAADQYSAAATLYHLLTGEHIFDFQENKLPTDLAQQFIMILHSSPIPIHQRRSDIPEQLNFILQRALAKDPKDRFSDLTEMKRSLQEFV